MAFRFVLGHSFSCAETFWAEGTRRRRRFLCLSQLRRSGAFIEQGSSTACLKACPDTNRRNDSYQGTDLSVPPDPGSALF
jgi:hypothetical protein